MTDEERAEICYECAGYGDDYRWDEESKDFISNCEDCWVNDFGRIDPDYEDMILARQELDEIFEDDPDIYESLLSGDYFEEEPELDLWLWGAD